MAIFQGFFLLAVGLLILAIAFRSLSRGWLPFGSNGFKGSLEIRRQENPTSFWAVFALYALLGFAVALYAALMLIGIAPPLPLRGGQGRVSC